MSLASTKRKRKNEKSTKEWTKKRKNLGPDQPPRQQTKVRGSMENKSLITITIQSYFHSSMDLIGRTEVKPSAFKK